jgi:hypothetical protein
MNINFITRKQNNSIPSKMRQLDNFRGSFILVNRILLTFAKIEIKLMFPRINRNSLTKKRDFKPTLKPTVLNILLRKKQCK